jgi:ABC-type sugar transport system permease subunit
MGQMTAAGGQVRTGTASVRGHLRAPRGDWTGLLMAAPVLVLVAVFTLYPFGQAIYESTRITSPLFPPKFVGLENYVAVITSTYFLDAALTTLLFAGIAVPIVVVLGVLAALVLNERFVGNTALRVGMLLPWAIPASVSGLIWKWVFLDSWGALNAGLYSVGIIDTSSSGRSCPLPPFSFSSLSRRCQTTSMRPPRSTAPKPSPASGRSPCPASGPCF